MENLLLQCNGLHEIDYGFDHAQLLALINELPGSLRGVQESFPKFVMNDYLVFLIFLAPLLITIGIIIWYKVKNHIHPQEKTLNSPDRLFDEILNEVQLEQDEKKLLRRMAKESRLKFPAMCLLSPGMLAMGRDLWREEKGEALVNDTMTSRIDQISIKLYDHTTSSEPTQKKMNSIS